MATPPAGPSACSHVQWNTQQALQQTVLPHHLHCLMSQCGHLCREFEQAGQCHTVGAGITAAWYSMVLSMVLLVLLSMDSSRMVLLALRARPFHPYPFHCVANDPNHSRGHGYRPALSTVEEVIR